MYRCCCQRAANRAQNTGPDRALFQRDILATRGMCSVAIRHGQCITVGRQLRARGSLFQSAWGTAVDAQTMAQVIAPQLFAVSLFPYIGFLYHLTRGQQQSGAPKLMVFGFYFLLVFVFATIPAGIYAKTVYQTSLANVDWLHGTSEVLLTVTNLFIVVGIRQGIMSQQQAPDEGGDPEGDDKQIEDTSSTR